MDKSESKPDLLSLMKSWDVESFLEQNSEQEVCKYFSSTGSCPYQEVGCMFQHVKESEENNDKENDEKEEESKENGVGDKLQLRERLSARSRNRKVNEERFRRLRDLSLSCP